MGCSLTIVDDNDCRATWQVEIIEEERNAMDAVQDRAEKAESALAALRKRIDEAPVVEWSREDWTDHMLECPADVIGKRVALVVLE